MHCWRLSAYVVWRRCVLWSWMYWKVLQLFSIVKKSSCFAYCGVPKINAKFEFKLHFLLCPRHVNEAVKMLSSKVKNMSYSCLCYGKVFSLHVFLTSLKCCFLGARWEAAYVRRKSCVNDWEIFWSLSRGNGCSCGHEINWMDTEESFVSSPCFGLVMLDSSVTFKLLFLEVQ